MTRDGKITRDVVLAAALEIIDRDGAEGLSMRRLARALTGARRSSTGPRRTRRRCSTESPRSCCPAQGEPCRPGLGRAAAYHRPGLPRASGGQFADRLCQAVRCEDLRQLAVGSGQELFFADVAVDRVRHVASSPKPHSQRNPWSAGCGKPRTSGAEGGPGETGRRRLRNRAPVRPLPWRQRCRRAPGGAPDLPDCGSL